MAGVAEKDKDKVKTRAEKEKEAKEKAEKMEKQLKLTDKWGKKVIFEDEKVRNLEKEVGKLEREIENLKSYVKEEIRKSRVEKVEFEKINASLVCEISGLKETIGELSKKVDFLESRERERRAEVGKGECVRE